MKKDIFYILNLCIVLTYFIANILFILIPEYDFKKVLIVETAFIPFIYLLLFILLKIEGSDKE